MKKIIFMLLTLLSVVSVNAQLKVTSSGNVSIKDSIQDDHAMLSIGSDPEYFPVNSSVLKTGLYVHSRQTASNGSCEGIFAEAISNGGNSPYSYSAGVWGIGRGATNGLNIGVMGTVYPLESGAGIFGTDEGVIPPFVDFSGGYAGYFYGNTFFDGNINALGVYTFSDMRLKDNVRFLSDYKKDDKSTIDKLLELNVIEYNLKHPRQKEEDAWRKEKGLKSRNVREIRHFGVSAQELKKLYPNLVKEENDGYLSVNYIELVPLLLQGIQELKQESDSLKHEIEELKAMYDVLGGKSPIADGK